MSPLVLRSYAIWDEIEKETGKNLLTITGGITLGAYNSTAIDDDASRYLRNTIQAAKKFGIAHRILETKNIQEQFPQFNLQGNEIGYYEEKAGFLHPEVCIETQLQLAEKYGASIHKNEKILEIIPIDDNTVVVKTECGEYTAEKVILSVGAWISAFLPQSYTDTFKVYRQVLYWFDPKENYELFTPDKFPVFLWEFSDGSKNFIYGFPAVDSEHGGVKVATEQYIQTVDPDTVNREVTQSEIDEMYNTYIKNNLKLSDTCLKAQSCLYTVTPDSNFVLDLHPEYSNVIIASPCSGHGFKHSAAIGEVLAELAIYGKSNIDISKFSLKRFVKEHSDVTSNPIVLIADPRVVQVPIIENHDPLIDLKGQTIIAYGPSPEIPDNQDYTKMRLAVYTKLQEAQALLPQGLFFCIYESYRSVSTQKKLFDDRHQKLHALHPKWSQEQCFEETTKLVSPVINKDGSTNIPPHSTGGAFDIYLIDDAGNIVDMGICVKDWMSDTTGELSATHSDKISAQAQAYRKIMCEVLEKVGFVNYSTEYWHWSFGDRYWAYHKKSSHAIYDAIMTQSRQG